MINLVPRRFLSMRRWVLFNCSLLILAAVCLAFGEAGETVSLYQAMRDGKVIATFKGTGESSGDSVEVEVAKTPKAGPGPLRLTIPPGSMLHSANGGEQNMVIMGIEGLSTGGGTFEPTSSILVSSTRAVTYVLLAFCTEFEKENPSATDTFTLEEPVPVLACLAKGGKARSIGAEQAAVWQYTDHLTYAEVNQKFSVSPVDWAAASDALTHCRSNESGPTTVPGSGPVAAETPNTGGTNLGISQTSGLQHAPPAAADFPPTRLDEAIMSLGYPIFPVSVQYAQDNVQKLQAQGCSHENNEKCGGASGMAGDLYILGKYDEALAFANEDVASEARFADTALASESQNYALWSSILEQNYDFLSKDYALRAFIKYALSDNGGSLGDLNTAFVYRNKWIQVASDRAQQPNIAGAAEQLELIQKVAKTDELHIHLCRAVVLARMRRYQEAMNEVEDAAGQPDAAILRLQIQTKMITDPGIPAPNSNADQLGQGSPPSQGAVEVTDQATQAIVLSGEWSCEPSAWTCDGATVSVSGNQFVAKLVRNRAYQMQPCDIERLTPSPHVDANAICYGVWDLVGTIDGAAVQGVATYTSNPADALGCSFPRQSHRFNGTVKENGHLIAITTESTTWHFSFHDAKEWVWQKPRWVCDSDSPTVDHTEAVEIILRSN